MGDSPGSQGDYQADEISAEHISSTLSQDTLLRIRTKASSDTVNGWSTRFYQLQGCVPISLLHSLVSAKGTDPTFLQQCELAHQIQFVQRSGQCTLRPILEMMSIANPAPAMGLREETSVSPKRVSIHIEVIVTDTVGPVSFLQRIRMQILRSSL